MQKLLLVIPHLTIGGVQKSLVSALQTLDYDKYDVTLYLRKNRTTLLPYVDKRVNVIINRDTTHYYRKPYAVILQIMSVLCKVLGKKDKADFYDKQLAEKIRIDSMEYEKKAYFDNMYFDKAIAYVQGYTAEFVAEYIDAKEKYMFFHTSVNEVPGIHNKILPIMKRVAALHEEQKELIKEWYDVADEKVAIVENFVSRQAIEQQSMEYAVSVPENKVILCSCGRLSPVKGFDTAVECAKILKAKGIEFLWYFVGDGPEREKLEKKIQEYNLSDYITITGMKENPYPYMRSCDIYIQPSYEEAMPVTIIESLKLKKPVVTTATVGGKKLVADGKTGLISKIDAVSLSQNIEALLCDKNLYNLILSNLNSADDTDELEKFKKQWQNLLEG